MDPNGNQIQLDPTEDEEIVARVAAIDVAKDSGMVCTRVPHPDRPRRRVTTVWSVPARTAAITDLAGQLTDEGIERVVLESTSEYWRPFYYLLEDHLAGGVFFFQGDFSQRREFFSFQSRKERDGFQEDGFLQSEQHGSSFRA